MKHQHKKEEEVEGGRRGGNNVAARIHMEVKKVSCRQMLILAWIEYVILVKKQNRP